MTELDPRLLDIIEDLIDTIELRDAGEPDTRWEADARIRRLEHELVERFRVVDRESVLVGAPEPALSGVF
jgi:hypothetical protein